MSEKKEKSLLRLRIDTEIKEEAELILKELGIRKTLAIELLYKQIIEHRKIPFDISLREKVREYKPPDPLKAHKSLERYKLSQGSIDSYHKAREKLISDGCLDGQKESLDEI